MKKLLISTLAATAVFASGAAFASDLISEDSFFTKVASGSSADAGVASTFDLPKVSEGNLFGDNQPGSHNPR